MPPYPIEIVNLGKPDFKLHEEVTRTLNSLQKDFIYYLPPERFRSWGSQYERTVYSTDDVYKTLTTYRAEVKGYHPFIVGLIHSNLNGERLGNLFSAFSPEKNLAIVTTVDWESYFAPPSLRAYLSYYFVNRTMKFVVPKLKSHVETRNCYFDQKIQKLDIKLSMISGLICDECRRVFEKKIDGFSYTSLMKLVEYVKDISTDSSNAQLSRPKVFLGSSTEGHRIAETIQLGLERHAECTIWSQGVFGLSRGNLENLVKAVSNFDYAILVLTPDDVSLKRNRTTNTPRDNVLFELGLFMGALGRDNTFLVYNRDQTLELPSDLAGVNAAQFGNRMDNNLEASLGPVCTQLKTAMGIA